MLSFPTKLKENDIESLLWLIQQDFGEQPLLLQLGSKYSHFGGLSSAIQAINTWARSSKTGVLHLSQGKRSKEQLVESTIEQPFKIIASMMATEIVTNDINKEGIKKTVYSAIKKNIEGQSKSLAGATRGGLCSYIFIDHSSKGFDKNFYIQADPTPVPKQISQFENIIYSMIHHSLTVSGGASALPSKKQVHEIGRVFYELFCNTHEHGSREKLKSKWIKPANRVLYTNAINLVESAVNAIKVENTALGNYLNSFSMTSSNRYRFIELSLIDSGLGFVGRWIADNKYTGSASELGLPEEYSVFEKCFTFRDTSSGEDHKGTGLPVVMQKLTELNGFMKVRSGRISVYRDFKNQPYSLGDLCDFYDKVSHKRCSENLTEMAQVVGVAITVLLPLEERR